MDGSFEGRRCCLGHLCKLVGMGDDLLRGKALPSSCSQLKPELKWLTEKDDTGCMQERNYSLVNDDLITSDEVKIEELASMFKAHGIDLVWRPDE